MSWIACIASDRVRARSQLACLSALSLLALVAGCATPSADRLFRENAHLRPDRAAMIEGLRRPRGDKLPADIACVESVILHWRQGSHSSVARWYAANRNTLAPAELPSRLAWAHGLWTSTTASTFDALRQNIRTGVPVVVLLQRSALNPDTRGYWLVAGFDDADRLVLAFKPGAAPQTIPYDQFEREWRVNRNWMMAALPPDFDRRPLDPRELFERGRFQEAAGAHGKAAADFEAAAAAGLGQSALFVRLGNTYRKLGRREDAEQAYRRAIAADPHNAQAYNNLAYLYAEGKTRIEEAVQLARQALVLEPANPLVLDTLGFALYQQGKTRDAADVLERARARAHWLPADAQADIGIHLIRAHVANAHYHLAREVLRDVLRIAPGADIPADLRNHEQLK